MGAIMRYPKLMTSRLLCVGSAVLLFASTTATGLNGMGFDAVRSYQSDRSEATRPLHRKSDGSVPEEASGPGSSSDKKTSTIGPLTPLR
jgi:hypothetical protein